MPSISLGSNRVVQIGLVVSNIEDAIQAWSSLLGVAPPAIGITQPMERTHAEYEGQLTPARARLAFFQLGQVGLELIEPVGEPSTWRDQLAAHGPSIHHMAFEIKGMDEQLSALDTG